MAVMTAARRWLRLKVPFGLAASFDAWLAAPVRSEYVLCEPEPSKTLMGFTAVGGGAPNTYVMSVPRCHQTDIVGGGVFGQVIGVQENAARLTAQTSLAYVDAHPGSWWWDEANELLYVRTTTGGDPDSFTLMQAQIRLFLSNAPLILRRVATDAASAVYYEPWLTDDVPVIQRTREDLLFGAMEVPSGSVSFTNGHRAWFTWVAPDGVWNWKNKPVRFYIGGGYDGVSLTRQQYAPMATMRIEDVAPNEHTCQFALQPLQRRAELELPVTPFFSDSYPFLGDGVEGTKKWIGYGRATMKPDLTDTSSYGGYTIADAAFQTLFAVHAVWAIAKATGLWTPLTLTTHYTVNLTACTLTIVSATYAHADYEIAVDVTGKPDGAGSYFRTYGAITRDLLETFVAAGLEELDVAAFTAAAAEAPNEIGFWIKQPRVLTSLFATIQPELPSLGRSAMGTVQQTNTGTWTASIWSPDVDAIETALVKSDFTDFAPKPKLKTIFPTVRVFYNFDHARQQWSVVEHDDPATRYRTDSRDRVDVYTYLRSPSAAQRLAERYQLLSGGVTVEAAFVERGARLATQPAGGKTLVTYDPAPAVAGVYENQPFEVLTMEIGLAPKLRVAGVLGNFHGLGGRVGRWMDPAAPDWATATAAARLPAGFWCDSDGRADPGDPASAQQSIWF